MDIQQAAGGDYILVALLVEGGKERQQIYAPIAVR
jgi:hypothetical protein